MTPEDWKRLNQYFVWKPTKVHVVKTNKFIEQLNHHTTTIVLNSYDLLETDVEKSQNKEAIKMLEAIGIRC